MVTFIPAIDPAKIDNPGERKVADTLSVQLSDQIKVIHSMNWVQKRSAGPLIEGECDFVVIDPKNGLLFVEVKGGILGFDADNGEWWRLSRHETKVPLNKDPFKQVLNSMHAIVKLIVERLRLPALHCTYGYAVIFPDGIFHGNLPPSITRSQILDANDLVNLSERLRRVFKLFKRKTSQTLSRDDVRNIEVALYPKYDIVPVEWRMIEDQEQRLHRLTEEQKYVLEVLSKQPLAAIQGGAGTGKTLLALAKAQQATRAGMRTLLLCYNRQLRNWLSDTAELEFEHELTVRTYHELVHEFCDASGLEFNPDSKKNQRDFWNERSPELLMQACDLLPESNKFDAVIVDEGQDFQELWWHSLDSVFKDPDNKACYYIFFDPNQNLFIREDVGLPSELGEPFLLEKNCRNSPEIAEYCERLIDSIPSSDNHSLDVFEVPSREVGFQTISDLVNYLFSPATGGLKSSQIVVLVPGYPDDDWPTKFKQIPATRDLDAWRNNQGVLIESYARFKGLEADAVIILTAPLDDSDTRHRRLNYVACSRAKHLLKIVEVVGN